MLRVLQYEKRSQIIDYFSSYDPQKQTWLVSDLRTKFELQQSLLSDRGFYVDEAVLRASDLWRLLLRRLDPQIRDVSDSFIRSLLKSFLDKHAEVLGVSSSSEESVNAYMNLLSSIHLHPEGPERLTEWFVENPASALRWQEWALRARLATNYMVQEEKILSGQWVTAYLQKFNRLDHVWSQDLIVDLGGEISRVEAELLRALSRHCDVLILEPVPLWRADFNFLLKPYEDLRAQSQDVKVSPTSIVQTKKTEVLRFSGMLAEVKEAVSRVRSWLDSGIAAEEISVVAPDIEVYWPVLQSFFEVEGVPVQKDISGKLQGLPSMIRWLSSLRSKSGRLSTSDLEISFYQTDVSQNVRYEEFRALFKSLYVDEDLSRNEWVEQLFLTKKINAEDILKRDEFVTRCMLEWQGADSDPVQTVLRELLKNATEAITLSWKEWLGYLENIVATKEYPVKKGLRDGVMVTKLMSAHSAKTKYRIFLGLSEESLKNRSKISLMGEDYAGLARDIGFYLDNPDQSDLEFELKVLAEAHSFEDLYFFGATDFSGSILSPSSFWIELKSQGGQMDNIEQLSVPSDTRWDEMQRSDLPVNERIEMDLGHRPTPPMKLATWPSISASAIESFLKCPFIFAAQKYFRLQDLPDIELDIDHRTRGQLAHALFERLTIEPLRYDWSLSEIEDVLEDARTQSKMIFADEKLWQPFRRKHVQIAKRFLENEKELRAKFPKTKTIGRETRFEFYLNPETKMISNEPAEGHFRLSGLVDRIDSDQEGQLVLIDYKSSAASAYSHGTWISGNHIQLLMYMWVVEQELMGDIRGEVIGLFYYIFKNFEKKGFRIDERAGALFPEPKRKAKGYDAETKSQYLAAFYELLLGTLKRIGDGELAPQPADISDCKKCEWRRLCRAPHLN